MRVLMVASEVAPFQKTGGLGDVLESLPNALIKTSNDVEIDILVPKFPHAKVENVSSYTGLELDVPFEGNSFVVSFEYIQLGSRRRVLFARSPLFIPGYKDKRVSPSTQYAFFNRIIVEYIKSQYNTYDVIHAHDWHTGLFPHLLEDELGTSRPPVVFTIHNLAYQGVSDPDVLQDLGISPGSHPSINWDIEDGDLNFLEQGILSADFITTVSPSYAEEILTAEFGGPLSDILKARSMRLKGILNGIDYTLYPRSYDVHNWEKYKKEYKKKLYANLKLSKFNDDSPLFVFIGRLDGNQKGLALLRDIVPLFTKLDASFILLGTGNSDWENTFKKLSEKFSSHFYAHIDFDSQLALNLYRASDFILVPSRYEPCGLVQLIAMWYGSLPIVHAVGGLKDTVLNGVTGYTFSSYDSRTLSNIVTKAFNNKDTPLHSRMVTQAMLSDFSWSKSAKEYLSIYNKVLSEKV